MVTVNKRPVRETPEESFEERTYRSKKISLNIGGLNAPVDAYAGETMILMRIMPRMTKLRGISNPAHSLEGIDPETGEFLILFFDTKLKEDGSYVRNFGGGLAETLGDKMTEDEFFEAMDILSAETGKDLICHKADWDAYGGALKLKDKFFGKIVTIGKWCTKIKNGTKMNVFDLDLPKTDYDPDVVETQIESFERTVGQPQEGAASSPKSKTRAKPTETDKADEPKPANKQTAYEKEVAKQNGSKKTKMPIPDYIAQCQGMELNDTAIIACLCKDYGMTEHDAANHVKAAQITEEKPVVKPAAKPAVEESLEARLVKMGKSCHKDGLSVPEAYGVLEESFKEASKSQIRTALQMSGVIR